MPESPDQGQYAGRMGDGDGAAQPQALRYIRPRADQVGGDKGLAVARRQGVDRSQGTG